MSGREFAAMVAFSLGYTAYVWVAIAVALALLGEGVLGVAVGLVLGLGPLLIIGYLTLVRGVGGNP